MAVTVRQVWEGLLTECSKTKAPSILLQDFNYFLNKTINQYINKKYGNYDINQQSTDDLRVLKSSCILDVTTSDLLNKSLEGNYPKLFGVTYEAVLPSDYLHILNCICIYTRKKKRCTNQDDYMQFPAKRLTADSWPLILNDYYNRPAPERPYFYIHTVNYQNELPTNPKIKENPNGNDISLRETPAIYQGWYLVSGPSSAPREVYSTNANGTVWYWDQELTDLVKNFNIDNLSHVTQIKDSSVQFASPFKRQVQLKVGNLTKEVSTTDKEAGVRYGNPSQVRIEIRCGQDNSKYELKNLLIDYLKTPQTLKLTQEQLNLVEDTSQILEFPDYICQEIINELTMLVLENTSNPRLQSNTVVSQSIVNSAQQQTNQQVNSL